MNSTARQPCWISEVVKDKYSGLENCSVLKIHTAGLSTQLWSGAIVPSCIRWGTTKAMSSDDLVPFPPEAVQRPS